jgi:aryl-alcohol dehydrogenase-like predicted oxidoreductase
MGIGTWQFGGEWGKQFTSAEASAILGRAHELGINLIDTAECYGEHLSEQLVGQHIKTEREQWVVATKFGHHFHSHLQRSEHWSPSEVREQLEASLKALQTDYIDVYQFHSGSNTVFDRDDLWEMLQEQVHAGKVRYIGISISSNQNIYQSAAATRVGASTLQVVYNRLDRQPEEQVFPSCIEQNLGVLARVPLASGFLSGRYKPGDTFSGQDVRAARDPEQTQARLIAVEQIRQTEVPPDVDMATWALAWCLRHPAVSCVIPGCKSVAQVEANAKAAELVSKDHPQAVNLDRP